MGSLGNPNQWQTYDTYKDCSLGICSIYCPQWCYIIFPPPPPYGYGRYNSNSPTDFSPLIIAIIGILASAFILVSYYTIISKYCRNRANNNNNNRSSTSTDEIEDIQNQNHQPPPPGLDEALIKSITVYKYKRGEGLVQESDCSVCLSEFEDSESLRLLPKCSHAFHLPCIDTWLKSHSTCPLCRSNIILIPPTTQDMMIQSSEGEGLSVSMSALQCQHRSHDTVLVLQDLQAMMTVRAEEEEQASGLGNENGDRDTKIQTTRQVSNSFSSQGNVSVSVADILKQNQDSEEEEEDDDELQVGIGPSKVFVQDNFQSNYKTRVFNLGMDRSGSTGKPPLTNYGKGKSCIVPS